MLLLAVVKFYTSYNMEQEAHDKVELGETPRRLIWKCCRYSSVKKFEDAFWQLIKLDANKAIGCGIFGHLSNFYKCWPEAAGDVISDVGTDIHASFGDSRL